MKVAQTSVFGLQGLRALSGCYLDFNEKILSQHVPSFSGDCFSRMRALASYSRSCQCDRGMIGMYQMYLFYVLHMFSFREIRVEAAKYWEELNCYCRCSSRAWNEQLHTTQRRGLWSMISSPKPCEQYDQSGARQHYFFVKSITIVTSALRLWMVLYILLYSSGIDDSRPAGCIALS